MRCQFIVAGVISLGAGLIGLSPAWAQLDLQNLVPCAQEGQICRMPYPTNVYYGAPGRTHGRPFPQGGTIPCNAQSFGDPAPGLTKMCWYAPKMGEGRRNDRNERRARDAFPDRDDRRRDDRGRDDDRRRDDDRYRSRDSDYDRPRPRYEDDDRPRRYRPNPDAY